MKILFLVNNDGGLYLFRKELLETLVKNNDVFCSTPDEDGFLPNLEKIGCECITTNLNRRGMNPFEDIKLIRRYKRIIKQTKADVVLTYTVKPNVYGGIACQKMNVPYICNVTGLGTSIENGGLLSNLVLRLYKIALKKAECVFFQNEHNLSVFKDKGIVKENTVLLPGSGVNTIKHCLEDYPDDSDYFRFLFVGRIMKDKGVEELFQAMEMMAGEGKKVFLDVVGGYDEDYSQQINILENQGILKYHGHQEDVHSFYANTHCLVLPSYHEGMANVLLEAASTGRPVIASLVPGCEETFDDGITGFGCMVKDVASLKEAMARMCSTPWSERKEMGLRGREKVKNQFDRQIVVQAYKEQLKKIRI